MKTQYMVGGSDAACDWRWPEGQPVWVMSSKEGVRWYHDGPLNEEGRRMILAHFGLEPIENDLPLAIIAETPPASLAAMRRELEERLGLGHLEMASTRLGGCIPAASAA